MITSEKSDNYFPASSEFSHIVSELEKYIETPEESSLTFDFKVTSILTKKTVGLAYWADSYSRNCITIKLLNKDLKVYNNFFEINSEDNFILLDDIKLFALTMNRFEKFNLYGFVEQEICRYILNKIKNKPKELILSTSTVKSKLRSNYLSLKQIQEGGLSQSRLKEIEDDILNYLSQLLLRKNGSNGDREKYSILPLKVTNVKNLFPKFEEQLAKILANSNQQLEYNLFVELKETYQLSDDFLKLYLDEFLNVPDKKWYVVMTEETYKFLLDLFWSTKTSEDEFKHYFKILINELQKPKRLLRYWRGIIPTEQFSIVSSISNEIELKREAEG